ncbi:hypothetical protein G6F22_014758 [Rhizopus arrhizus]|nr:hypothetical protein G6F22_014758 [Rhizopus arrhizus]
MPPSRSSWCSWRRTRCDRGWVDGAVAQRAAYGQDDDGQDGHAGKRHLPPGQLRIGLGMAEQSECAPANHRQPAQAAQQRQLVAAPKHAGDFARMLQVFHEQPVGPGVVFQDERGRGDFQEGQQDERDQIPVAGDGRGDGEVPQQGRQHRGQRGQHGDLVRVDAQAAQQQRKQAASVTHALPLPCGQRQAAERQQRKRRHHENQG